MRAIVKPSPAPGLELADVPVPEPGPDDVAIDVRLTSICGTDLHIRDWDPWAASTIPTPLVIGHEFMGVVASVGDGVEGITAGMRV